MDRPLTPQLDYFVLIFKFSFSLRQNHVKFFCTVHFQKLPPVRNSFLKKKKKTKKKQQEDTENTSNKSKRIHGYDYRAWDKFDVVSVI